MGKAFGRDVWIRGGRLVYFESVSIRVSHGAVWMAFGVELRWSVWIGIICGFLIDLVPNFAHEDPSKFAFGQCSSNWENRTENEHFPPHPNPLIVSNKRLPSAQNIPNQSHSKSKPQTPAIANSSSLKSANSNNYEKSWMDAVTLSR